MNAAMDNAAMRHWYHGHGLVIRSDIELPLAPCPPGDQRPDLVLRRGPDREVPGGEPPGTTPSPAVPPPALLAELTGADGTVFYRLTRTGRGAVLRYPGVCEFVATDPGLTEVSAHLHPGADRGLLPVLAAGTLLAVHLMLRPELVLHASAVRHNGHAVAFVGASGMGKSTLAAALCEMGMGCALVADDVLRADLTDPASVRVYPGSTESRLRPSARELADAAPPEAVRPTADGRLALRARTRADGLVPLAACVLPRPSRDATRLSIRRLSPADALCRMIMFPRVLGWCEPVSSRHTFQALGDLVERVPVVEATVPWGPPFRPGVLAELLSALVPGPALLPAPRPTPVPSRSNGSGPRPAVDHR